MPLVTLSKVSLAFGFKPLLDQIDFKIDANERICLIGRNGEGKSSLLKLIQGQLKVDSGEIWFENGIKIATLAQELPQDLNITVYHEIANGLPNAGNYLNEYHELSSQLNDDSKDHANILQKMDQLQSKIDAVEGWQLDHKIKTIINKLNLPEDALLSSLSGGWIRRVLLGKALILEPDLLLLDEPTNHLDIEAIEWLENTLLQTFKGSVLFITHDRSFLQKLATKIIELDRGKLSEFIGDYANYLRRKEEMLHAEEKANELFDKKLAQEEVWIRQGIKARRTRNEGRVRALKQLRRERSERRNKIGKVSLEIDQSNLSGKKVIEAHNISFQYGDNVLIRDFSSCIQRGDKIGLVGANGVGKSTLIKILLGQLSPTKGSIELGTKLDITYFDQMRAALDIEKTVVENVCEGDYVEINGKKHHAIKWLQDFLFSPERARTPIKYLSGGEKNRLLLAKLFTKPSNFLVLDEPTNDLDVETLEMLEELLSEFQGTVLIVSHDRSFLDQVVTSIYAFDGQGNIQEHVGGYFDYVQSQKNRVNKDEKGSKNNKSDKKEILIEEPKSVPKNNKKLSYKETKMLESLPDMIAKLEEEIDTLTRSIQLPEFYKQSTEQQSATLRIIDEKTQTLESFFAQWDELENKKTS